MFQQHPEILRVLVEQRREELRQDFQDRRVRRPVRRRQRWRRQH